jgi:hypothetical protein
VGDVALHVGGIVVLGAVELEVAVGAHDHVEAVELVQRRDAVAVPVRIRFDVVGAGEEVDGFGGDGYEAAAD